MFKQIELKYDYNALEPHIDALTMETHYSKHHAAYTKNFNDAVSKLGLEDKSDTEILSSVDSIADNALKTAIINNGGGYYNHNLYFDIMSPNPKKDPSGDLKDKIDSTFGGVDKLIDALSSASAGQFGSGWGWLSTNANGDLTVSSSANQSNPLIESKGELTPILGIDVWEHAYYLKYKNLRADYIKAFFNVLDWAKVEERYKNR